MHFLAPVVNSISPESDTSSSGGTSVVIEGLNFGLSDVPLEQIRISLCFLILHEIYITFISLSCNRSVHWRQPMHWSKPHF